MEKTQECEKSKLIFETVIKLLGQEAEVSPRSTGKNIVLNVTSEDPGRLIGRKGIALNSITHLMNLVLKRENSDHPHIVIDVKGKDEEGKPRREKRKPNNRRNNPRNNRRREDEAPKVEDVAKEASDKTQAPKQEAKVEDVAKEASDKTQVPKQEAKVAKAAPKQEAKVAPKVEEAAPKQEARATEKTEAPKQEAKKAPKKKLSRLEIECRNAAREVKKWGEDTYLPPMNEGDSFKALDYFKNDKEITAAIDESRSSGDKKRVKLTIQA